MTTLLAEHPCFQVKSQLNQPQPDRLASLRDNYSWILTLQCRTSGRPHGVAIIDTTDSQPIKDYFSHSTLPLMAIINTHHHYDHTGGNDYLVKHHHPIHGVYGSARDRDRIPHLTQPLHDGATFTLNPFTFVAWEMDGHTQGHMIYHEPQQKWLFTGDALFSLGCGKMFEGTPKMMVTSLAKLKNFPPETLIFCGHEYTHTNAQFSLSIDPYNTTLRDFYHTLSQNLAHNPHFASIPSTLGFERTYNPFLQLDNPDFLERAIIPAHLKTAHLHPSLQEELFLWLRTQKDNFVPASPRT